jgi:hypothetical protein
VSYNNVGGDASITAMATPESSRISLVSIGVRSAVVGNPKASPTLSHMKMTLV